MTLVQDNAASVRGIALRATRLGPDGAPATGTDCDVYLSGGFISFQFTPEYSEGDEIEVKNAAGDTCVYYKLPDTLKNVGLQLELCDPDPILTQMLVGGEVLTASGSSAFAPAGTSASDQVAIGYASELAGVQATPDGVALEIWAGAVVNGKAASRAPYWHYVFPYAQFRLDGDRVVENGNLATVFAGTATGNEAFGTGPNMDLSDVTPQPAGGAFDWKFPAYTDRPYLFSRALAAPVGLRGVFDNLGIPIVSIQAGDPGSYNPTNATRPSNLAALRAGGAYGNTSSWATNQYIVLGDGSEAYWDGDSWELGRKPAAAITPTGATAGSPGSFTPNGATPPTTLAALQSGSITASPTTAWTTGQRVLLGNGTTAYWTGSAWAAGSAP